MKTRKIILAGITLILVTLACTLGQPPPHPATPKLATVSPVTSTPQPLPPPSGDVIVPTDLIYLGAFRLPDNPEWEYSGHGLTFYPNGDPAGPDDGYPGSLFGVGHDHRLLVSEISIPVPVVSKKLDDLNYAETLQPFADLTGGTITEELAIPRLGLEYLPAQGGQTTDKLHFAWGQHIQGFEPSHGWAELDLLKPQPAGTWVFNGYTNYVTNDYIFEIPHEWADAYAPGQYLATGRAREGPWSGFGPALFAYAPWQDGEPPAPNSTLSTLTPLLLYGVQEPGNPEIVADESMMMNGYQDSDHWWGGAWLNAGAKSAVVFVGTKALGSSWYGFANGVVWEYDCVEQNPPTCPEYPDWPYDNRGFWAEGYQAQMIFYNSADLALVARGEMQTWEPQPYATLVLDDYLFDPELNHADYKRDLVGAMAFDRVHGLVFVIERMADEYKSVIHVWELAP